MSDVYYFYLDCGSGGMYIVCKHMETCILICVHHLGWLGNDPRYISPTQQQTADDTFNYGGTGGSWCAPYKVYRSDTEDSTIYGQQTWLTIHTFRPLFVCLFNRLGNVYILTI